MKTLLALIMAIFVMAQSATAQNNKLSIGIHAGSMATGLINQNPYNTDKLPVSSTVGQSKRLSVDYTINDKLSLGSGLSYASMGQNYIDFIDENTYEDRNIQLNYVQIPVELRYMRGTGAVQFISGLGFQYGHLVSSVFEQNLDATTIEGEPILKRTMEEDSDRFQKASFSLINHVGAKVKILDRVSAVAKVQSLIGLTDINDVDYRYEDEWMRDYKATRNMSAGFELGLQIKL